jgi:hypothetical protein
VRAAAASYRAAVARAQDENYDNAVLSAVVQLRLDVHSSTEYSVRV